MQLEHLFLSLVSSLLVAGCAGKPRPPGASPVPRPGAESIIPSVFLPQPLADEWTQWIVGDWEGSGESNAGKGKGKFRVELALSGQFLLLRSEAELTELNPDYLKKHMQATDEEIDRFKRSGYQALEIYTADPKTGEVLGFLFDNLRCLATGKGKREGFRETVDWEWRTGHKSTRVTERVNSDRMRVIERTRQADGSVMEDKGEMVRIGR